MFCIAEKSVSRSRLRPSKRPLYAVMFVVLGLLAMVAFEASAQDLTKYAASPISVFASSTTANPDGEDGIPATSAEFDLLTVAVDGANNVYFADSVVPRVRMVYVGGPVPPLLQFALAVNATLGTGPTTATIGDVYTVANIQKASCIAGSTCGDGGQAGLASFSVPWGLAFDSSGNLYICDEGAFSVRKVSVTDGTISTVAGDPLHSNSTYNGDNIPALGAYLTAPTFITFDTSNDLFIADSGANGGSNLVRRVDAQTQVITTVAGNNTMPGVLCSDNVCGEGGPATSALLGGLNSVTVDGAGDLFLAESNENVVREVSHTSGQINTVAGQLGVACADTTCGGEGVAATSATLNYPFDVTLDGSGNVIITDQNDNVIRGILSDGTIRTLAGVLDQTPGPPATTTGSATSVQFYNPFAAVIDSTGNLFIADTNNNLMWEVSAPVTLPPQTITFTQIPNATYGNPAINLSNYATASSGLAISFTCTGPVTCSGTNGATLTVTGAGSVTVTANQAGNSSYAPATAQTSTFTVAQAALTVKADNISFAFQSAAHLPPLTYTFVGLVNGDSASAVTGTPVLTTTATATSPIGEYPIAVALGTLTSVNYSFIPANGTLTITGNAAQTITFNALPNVTYGVATFTLAATATSGQPVSYSVSGPAQLLGNAVTVTGVGTVSVTANQSGDAQYGPASPVTQSFQVAPAVLNIAAQPASRPYNSANPVFTYVATGFVSADTSAVLSGAPVFTTTAVLTSLPGTYPLMISQGTLFASNYTFTFTNSTLAVGLAPQTITFPAATSAVFGIGIPLTATASSGLAVVYTVSGPATISGGILYSTMPGAVTVTASQPGDSSYQAAPPVVQTFIFQKAPLTVQANNFTIPFGGAIPTFTYTFGDGSFTPPANEFSGVPSFTTVATSTSAPGVYPITGSQGSLVSNYFDFQFVSGTLTILQPSSFIFTATPASVTIPSGQARQVTITLTPVNDFVGSVTLGCSNLPEGVTCVSSPNTLTTVLAVSGVNPVTATLTISAGVPVASAQLSTAKGHALLAGWFWFPSFLLGGLLTWQRRRLLQYEQAYRLLFVFLMMLGASGLIACGTSGGSTSVQPGTTMIQVTGAGTSTSGSTSASLALSVTIQ